MSNFVVGDVVQLKSGGPPMVIVAINDGTAVCAWHDSEGKPHTESYPLAALKKLSPTPTPTPPSAIGFRKSRKY